MVHAAFGCGIEVCPLNSRSMLDGPGNRLLLGTARTIPSPRGRNTVGTGRESGADGAGPRSSFAAHQPPRAVSPVLGLFVHLFHVGDKLFVEQRVQFPLEEEPALLRVG